MGPKVLIILNTEMRPYFRQIVIGVAEYANQHQHPSWQLSLPNYFGVNRPFPIQVPQDFDGIITGISEPEVISDWLQNGKATSLIGPEIECQSDLAYLDLEEVVVMGCQKLLDSGAEELAYFGTNYKMDLWSKKMIHAFQEFSGSAHILLPDVYDYWGYNGESSELRNWLKSLPPKCGILTGNDDYAGRIYEAASIEGLRPGIDFTVIGLGNDPIYCESHKPSLTSMMLPLQQMGFKAAQHLAERLEDPSLDFRRCNVGSPTIAQRSSHYVHEAEDPFVDRALDLLRSHITTIRSASDLATEIGTTRHTLQRHFNHVLGKPPGEVIREIRIQEAQRLITTTQLTLAEVASQAGFTDQAHMTRILKSHLGRTPGQLVRDSRLGEL